MSGPVELAPQRTPLGKFGFLLIFTLIWNGGVAVFVWQAVGPHRQGGPDVDLACFLSIFVLIGLGLVVGTVHAFLALGNPRPHLTLSEGSPRLGERVDVAWRFTGRPERLRRLTLSLVGREEATRRGSRSNPTNRHVFRTVPLFETAEPLEIAEGSARFTVPEDTVPSLAAPHNKVVWFLSVEGEIRHWPDVSEELALEILPASPRGSW